MTTYRRGVTAHLDGASPDQPSPSGLDTARQPIPLLALPYAVRTVLRRWRGTIGMVLGVGIALGIGMTMLGVNTATLDLYTREYRLSGADFRVIQQGGTLVPLLPSDSPGTLKHATSRLAQIRGMPGVIQAVGAVSWELERERPGPKRTDQPAELVGVMGIDGEPDKIDGTVVIDSGRWLRRSDELVVGSRLSREKGITLGQSVRLGGRDFQVVGIGKLRGFGFQADSIAYLDRQSLRQRADLGDVVNVIAVDSSRPEATRARLADLDAVSVYDVPETVRLAEKALESDVVSHWTMTLMILSVAAIFVNNMLGGSVEARRLELATLRAIGVPSRTILLSVAGEALAICAAASVVGVVVATLFGTIINGYVAPAYGQEEFYAADRTLIVTVVALSLTLGALASLGPARQAVRVDPVEVLRDA
ncbi:MAG: ABC transporter permease [Chloroflexi bacterium]|nr:ABC transporter permease [Chloroflexota bacterium]